MKHLVLYFLLLSQIALGQKILKIPEHGEFVKYFYARQHAIQNKLYRLALEGKIKAYKNDSLKSAHSLEKVAWLGGTEISLWVQTNPDDPTEGYDSIISNRFNVEDIKALRFLKRVQQGHDEYTSSTLFKGMALIHEVRYAGLSVGHYTLFWVSYEDMKKNLSQSEMDFLAKVSFYANNNDNPDPKVLDPYSDLNHSGALHFTTDSLLYSRLAYMLSYSNFYVSDQIYGRDPLQHKKFKIYDEQKKKLISMDSFNIAYAEKIALFVQTNPDDPTVGYDSSYLAAGSLERVYAITFNEATKKPSRYILVLDNLLTNGQPIKFSFDIDPKYPPIANILWFYEDYITWKGL